MVADLCSSSSYAHNPYAFPMFMSALLMVLFGIYALTRGDKRREQIAARSHCLPQYPTCRDGPDVHYAGPKPRRSFLQTCPLLRLLSPLPRRLPADSIFSWAAR